MVAFSRHRNYKSLISPYEIDIVLKNKLTNELIGIEYNGVFIHSIENGYKHGYHLNKTIKAENINIKLIHIFSSEWLYDRTRIISLIGSHIFGKYDFNLDLPIIRLDRSKYNLCIKL